ncbi:MAG: hypothetical protein KAT10_00030 [Sulfurimonas sp.]|nr:hypothetical protein [Sulfurimonas sp.]
MNKNIKRSIISLDVMSRDVYDKFSKFSHLQHISPAEMWEYYPKTGKNNLDPKTMFNEAPIIEPYLMVNYLKQKKISTVFWYNNALFIYNEKLFRIVGDKIVEIDIKNLCFISFRESFAHPFYKFLKIILEQSGGKLAKPNMQTMYNVGCMNKLYAFAELYHRREELLGDFIIPFNITPRDYPVFIKFLKDNLGDKIVFKQDCIQEGKGVIFKDLSKDNQLESITSILNAHKIKTREVFITSAVDIVNEYRCYFTNHGRKKTVFSIKQRVNSGDIDVYERDNIQIYKNISVKWLEVKTDSMVFENASKIAKSIMKDMSYDTGCLEFAYTKDGKVVFFEVNQMAGPLPFEGEDTTNMTNYYFSMFDKMID